MMSWSKKILSFQFGLKTDIPLPDQVEWIYPFGDDETQRCMKAFYTKYYSDNQPRTMLLGINPGRFGAGITGVPFTDPIKLEGACGIANSFKKRKELSSDFVYECIDALGGPDLFHKHFYITSVCPLGFIKDGKNYNYYDSKNLQNVVLPMIIDNIKTQIDFGANTDVVYSMGKGKNFAFLKKLNDQYKLFGKVVPLPHPRWVMQYRLKSKDEFVNSYFQLLNDHIHE